MLYLISVNIETRAISTSYRINLADHRVIVNTDVTSFCDSTVAPHLKQHKFHSTDLRKVELADADSSDIHSQI